MKKKLLDVWWRIEWAFWKRLVPDDIHRWLAYLMAGALHHVKGSEISGHWTWAMTPFPAGFPFICQYKKGLQMLLGNKGTIARVMKKNDEEWDEAMRDANEQLKRLREEPLHQGKGV